MRASIKEPTGVDNLVANLKGRILNPEVIKALIFQNQKYLSEKKSAVLNEVKEQSPLFVITGQQTGLFGGPLLTFYKAISAIQSAKTLKSQLGIPVVPLFWLQSEDHDLEEIAIATVEIPSGENKVISLVDEAVKINRQSVSRLKLGEEILRGVSELKDSIAGLPHEELVRELVENNYTPDNSWAASFLGMFGAIFQDTELLFFDLDASGLKSLPEVRAVFKKSISDAATIEEILLNTTNESNLTNGVVIKNGSPLLFIGDKKFNRYRLISKDNQSFVFPGGTDNFDSQGLIEAIDSDPTNVSTSALLRPIIQDTIFPTLAYIGGDAELVYHRQLDDLYGYFGLFAPILLPRGKFRIIGRKSQSIVDELKLSLSDFLLSDDEVGGKIRASGQKFGLDTEQYATLVGESIAKVTVALEGVVKEVDPTLLDPLRKSENSAVHAYLQFLSKLKKASYQRDSVILKRIEKIRLQVFPFGKEQERELSLVSVLARSGLALIDKLQTDNELFDGTVKTVIREEI
jgi:bacillithiol biosynthesis cysteine-adding enzyme BshC